MGAGQSRAYSYATAPTRWEELPPRGEAASDASLAFVFPFVGFCSEVLTGLLYRKRTILEYNPTMWSSSAVVACASFGLLLLVVFLIGRSFYRRREKLTVESKADNAERGRIAIR
ncbi:hypothetical protein EV421DRAFT_546213 [Armillaria borealis]|uniref:Uncharacterized protein n=1 Tax=Armillaria borealis TaxID=47425 RepID=A0AA39MD95_9AGAR|nr:hypothetical protein EV421DRAFT_546213 [Armillaria borealis]